jgi:hypothetical protein
MPRRPAARSAPTASVRQPPATGASGVSRHLSASARSRCEGRRRRNPGGESEVRGAASAATISPDRLNRSTVLAGRSWSISGFIGLRQRLLLVALAPLLMIIQPSDLHAQTLPTPRQSRREPPKPQVAMYAWTVGRAGNAHRLHFALPQDFLPVSRQVREQVADDPARACLDLGVMANGRPTHRWRSIKSDTISRTLTRKGWVAPP